MAPASCSSKKQDLHNICYSFQKYTSHENWDHSYVTEDQLRFSENICLVRKDAAQRWHEKKIPDMSWKGKGVQWRVFLGLVCSVLTCKNVLNVCEVCLAALLDSFLSRLLLTTFCFYCPVAKFTASSWNWVYTMQPYTVVSIPMKHVTFKCYFCPIRFVFYASFCQRNGWCNLKNISVPE